MPPRSEPEAVMQAVPQRDSGRASPQAFVRGGVSLHYRVSGTGTQPLICIHGVGSYCEAWDGVIGALGDAFRVLTFDLRGHGRSTRVRGRYEIDDFVGDVLALADHVGFAR